eukprot:15457654-Alexandrium_andersonii.AAC.1
MNAHDLLHDAGLPRCEAIRPPKIKAWCAGISHYDTRVRERFHPRRSPPTRFCPRVPEDGASTALFAGPFHDARLGWPP